MSDLDPFPGQELTPELEAAVEREVRVVPGPAGAPDVRVLLYRPKGAPAGLPLIVDIHGGAFAMRADNFLAGPAGLAALGATVVSVDYRPAPPARYPDGLEDCYAALCWAVEHLDVDRERVAVTGASAGGALAAGVALLARDRSGPRLALQALVIPVLDDRCATPSMGQYDVGPIFGGRDAKAMWDRYLGPDVDRSATPAYAAPGRSADLRGLPQAFIQVNALDPLRDEGLAYASALLVADVPVELYCAPRQHHGMGEDPRTEREARRLHHEALRAALELRPQVT